MKFCGVLEGFVGTSGTRRHANAYSSKN